MKKNSLTATFSKLLSIALLLSMVAFTGCSDDDDGPAPATENIYELMSADTDLSELKTFIDEFGLASALQSTSATTFFAPNNAAFDKLRATLGTDDLSTVAPAIIEQVLRFHVVESGGFTKSQLVTAGSAATNQGESIVVNTGAANSGTIQTGGSDDEVIILEADILATNGVMHKVETILIPPTIFASIGVNLGKLSQPILLGADFTILAAAIAKADTYAADQNETLLTSVLAGDEVYTVFAPSNGTFEAASITLDAFSAQEWYGIIANHVVPGAVAAADITAAGQTLTTAPEGTLTVLTLDAPTDPANGITTGIAIDSNGDTTPEAQVAVGDAFVASNGVLHVIAGVLVP